MTKREYIAYVEALPCPDETEVWIGSLDFGAGPVDDMPIVGFVGAKEYGWVYPVGSEKEYKILLKDGEVDDKHCRPIIILPRDL